MVPKAKIVLQDYCAALLLILFVYASLSKILDYDTFRQQLGLSPLISGNYTDFIALGVIASEMIIIILLCVGKFRSLGFYFSIFILSAFTAYIRILLSSDFIPCSCGGILGNLNWSIHIALNVFFIFVAIIGILKQPNELI